ncbi:7-carboxy-7-deazaguanine synthase QueE [Desmospora profundinema]|uniref:7-carboxy-7-deazaguanine synthase n=1 Tax=Desmospora profundinema TaxID=1571184 RepID=A0ABU1IQE6_9BACL|nr:radical SAM protein [Desmospora profundinema]MDR6225970.1 7-carboxy-7-deazaguanine synthase [Desmospora profundinema]
MSDWMLPDSETYLEWELPMVEIFETVEGEGMAAGFPTVFVRTFHCNLRCRWCDTPYSFAPAKPVFTATLRQIRERVGSYASRRICLTGGEPLLHREKSLALLETLASLPDVDDVHIETNGAVDLAPFDRWRRESVTGKKVRFILDWKLPDSGESDRMLPDNLSLLKERDELKFVLANRDDFRHAVEFLSRSPHRGQTLFSPVFGELEPRHLVEWVLAEPLPQVKVSLQLHKTIWDPAQRGV